MDSTFHDMIQSLFDNEAFTEEVYIEGIKTLCFCSSISDNLVFTESGLQDDCNFVLDVMIERLNRIPQEGDRVIFRTKSYKVASTQIDSAGVCIKLYLTSQSKGA